MTPVSAYVWPTVCSFLEVIEERIDNSTVEIALDEGKVLHIKEGMKKIW